MSTGIAVGTTTPHKRVRFRVFGAAVLVVGGLVGALAAPSMALADPNPLTITPGAVAAGGTITISGEDCVDEPGNGAVTVDGVGLPYAAADPSTGLWSTTYVIPADTPVGALVITAQCLGLDDFPDFSYPDTSVTVAVPPTASALTSTGVSPAAQSVAVTVPDGGSLALLSDGSAVESVTIDGQGVYTIDAATSSIVFTPVAGFVGAATPVTYRVTDPNTLFVDSTYTPTVTAAAAAPAPVAAAPTLAATGSDSTVPLVVAAILLALGAALTFGRRRRTSALD